MKILIAHNFYQSTMPSGENTAVLADVTLLREAGLDVVELFRHSDDLSHANRRDRLMAAVSATRSRAKLHQYREYLDHVRPDVVHVHNLLPLIGPDLLRAAYDLGIPVVQTMHNYRHSCINGLHVRDGSACDDCVGRKIPVPGIAHSCYRSSRLQSLAMATSHALNFETWREIDCVLALTPFMQNRLVDSGFSPEQVRLRPNFVHDPGPPTPIGRDFAFIGRLDVAKGVPTLLDAWRRAALPRRRLLVAGDGPLRGRLEQEDSSSSTVRYLGRLSVTEIQRLLDKSAGIVIPSTFYEGFPLVLAEAAAKGRAAIVRDGGSTASVVTPTTGWVFNHGSEGLAALLQSVTDDQLRQRGSGARRFFEQNLTPGESLRLLLETYASVVGSRRRNR
ncbi:MAG: glycosyltransferase [Actinomycetes bacterium]